jgi:hypothetical protein
MADIADAPDIMADTVDILARYRREADTSSAEAGRNSAAEHREHIETRVTAKGAAVNGAAVKGAVSGATANGTAVSGAAVTGIGTPLGAGAFLTRLTTVIILMGITLGIGMDLVIRITGVGTYIGAGVFLTCIAITLTGTILRMNTIMLITIAPYQEGDSLGPDPSRNSRLRTRLRRTKYAALRVCLSIFRLVNLRVSEQQPHHSLKSPLCSCVSITLHASSERE